MRFMTDPVIVYLWASTPAMAKEIRGAGLPVVTLPATINEETLPADLQCLRLIVSADPEAPRRLREQSPALSARLGEDCHLFHRTKGSPRKRKGVTPLPAGSILPVIFDFLGDTIAASRAKEILWRWMRDLLREPDSPELLLSILEDVKSIAGARWAYFHSPGGYQDHVPPLSLGLSREVERRLRQQLRKAVPHFADVPLLVPTTYRPPAAVRGIPGGCEKLCAIAIRNPGDSEPYLLILPANLGKRMPAGLRESVAAFQDILQFISRVQVLRDLTFQDDLTCLYNYRFLKETLHREIERSRRLQEVFSVLFIDLDNFKEVNDKHGHLVGSELLKEVAAIMSRQVREYDTVARYGGDEFLVIMPEAGTREAYRVAERLRKTVEDTRFLIKGEIRISLTTSVGVATYPVHASSRESMLEMADRAMYRAKQGKKNLVYIAE